MTDRERLIDLYRQMYDLTEPECRLSCRCPQSCCSPEYCVAAIEHAREWWGVTLTETGHPRLPLMGEKGCTAAPHLRPMCTIHTCDVGAYAFKMHPALDKKWDRKYWRLRNAIEALEVSLGKEARREGRPDQPGEAPTP
jgi:hypothetical protein